jgi:hypothetical protein
LPAREAVKPYFSGRISGCCENHSRRKSGKKSKFVEISYVNQNAYPVFHSHPPAALWKNLWKVWKTQGRQQIFSPKQRLARQMDHMHISMNKGCCRANQSGLCCRGKGGIFLETLAKKLEVLTKNGNQRRGRDLLSAEFLGKIHKAVHGMISRRREILCLSSDTGGTPCREK